MITVFHCHIQVFEEIGIKLTPFYTTLFSLPPYNVGSTDNNLVSFELSLVITVHRLRLYYMHLNVSLLH